MLEVCRSFQHWLLLVLRNTSELDPWIPPSSSDPRPWSNAFVDAIAGPLPYRETRRQTRSNLAYWLRRFWNGPHIASRTDSNLSMSFPNTSWKTEPLGAVRRIQSSLRAGYVLCLWKMILRPTWWLFAGLCPCISPAGLEQRREWKREWEHKRRRG